MRRMQPEARATMSHQTRIRTATALEIRGTHSFTVLRSFSDESVENRKLSQRQSCRHYNRIRCLEYVSAAHGKLTLMKKFMKFEDYGSSLSNLSIHRKTNVAETGEPRVRFEVALKLAQLLWNFIDFRMPWSSGCFVKCTLMRFDE